MGVSYKEFNDAYGRVMHILTGEWKICPKVEFEKHSEEELRDTHSLPFRKVCSKEDWEKLRQNLLVEKYHELLRLEQTLKNVMPLIPESEDKIPNKFSEIVDALSDYSFIKKHTIDEIERDLRRLGGPKNELWDELFPAPSSIIVKALNVVEQCFGRCTCCSVKALPTDGQMSWDLFQGIIESPDIYLPTSSNGVYLKDGEPLIYWDKKERKNLFDVVKTLIFERGCRVHITTAGLLRPNRKRGIPVLQALESLGVYATDVKVDVSFNFFSRTIKNIDEYVKSMEETFEILTTSMCKIVPVVMYDNNDEENKKETLKRFKQIEKKFGLNSGGTRPVGPAGFALDNFNFSERVLTQLIETNSMGCEDFLSKDRKPRFTIRTEGGLTPYCLNPGTRGTIIGNVLENDSEQVRELSLKFKEEFGKMIEERGSNVPRCELHANWKKVFKAPRSPNPIVRLPKKRIMR